MTDAQRPLVRELLYKIVDDTQATIRSMDAKVIVGIAILGAMLGKMLDRAEFDAIRAAGTFQVILFAVFSGLAISASVLAFKTLFPMINPSENVTFANDLRPPFFVHRFNVRSWRRLLFSGKKFAKLAETHESYCEALSKTTEDGIEGVLAGEVLKLSFIRQMKHDRLTAFAIALTLMVIVFVLLVFWVPAPASRISGT